MRRSVSRLVSRLMVGLVAGGLTVGCGGGAERPVGLPDTFPDDVPVPAEMEVDAAEEHDGTGSTLYEVTGWYDGDPIGAAREYESALVELGYDITSRTESPDNLFFVAENAEWYVSAGFFPDPVRNAGTSVGITVTPAG